MITAFRMQTKTTVSQLILISFATRAIINTISATETDMTTLPPLPEQQQRFTLSQRITQGV